MTSDSTTGSSFVTLVGSEQHAPATALTLAFGEHVEQIAHRAINARGNLTYSMSTAQHAIVATTTMVHLNENRSLTMRVADARLFISGSLNYRLAASCRNIVRIGERWA